MFRFTSQLPKLGILGRTIGRVVPQVAVFFLISCVIFLAFAQCFFLAYFSSVPGYQTFWQSLMSVLRFTVLDFDYAALSKVRFLATHFLFKGLFLCLAVPFPTCRARCWQLAEQGHQHDGSCMQSQSDGANRPMAAGVHAVQSMRLNSCSMRLPQQ